MTKHLKIYIKYVKNVILHNKVNVSENSWAAWYNISTASITCLVIQITGVLYQDLHLILSLAFLSHSPVCMNCSFLFLSAPVFSFPLCVNLDKPAGSAILCLFTNIFMLVSVCFYAYLFGAITIISVSFFSQSDSPLHPAWPMLASCLLHKAEPWKAQDLCCSFVLLFLFLFFYSILGFCRRNSLYSPAFVSDYSTTWQMTGPRWQTQQECHCQ